MQWLIERFKANRPAWAKELPWWMWLLFVIFGAVSSAAGYSACCEPEPPVVIVKPAANPALEPLDAGPIDYEGVPFEATHKHGAEDSHAEAARWPTDRITYYIDFRNTQSIRPALSPDAIREAIREGWKPWTDALKLEAVEVPNEGEALVRHRFGPIDGPSGTLAYSYLADNTLNPKEQLYDSAERWTAGEPAPNLVSLRTVSRHEIGHVIGLSHDEAVANVLMSPTYSSSVPTATARDIQRAIALGYRPRANVPPDDALSFPVTARASDVIEALRKKGYRVEK